MDILKIKKIITASLVIVVLPVMYIVYTICSKAFGEKIGYLLGFIIYWSMFCFLIPYLILGKQELKNLFLNTCPKYKKIKLVEIVLLVLPPLFAILFGPFIKLLPLVNFKIIILSLLLAIVNGFCEEVLWRGLYGRMFEHNKLLGCVLPAIGFSLWHIAPQAVYPYDQGLIPFLFGALFIGICWNIVTYRTKSIRWTILAHIILDFSGFGALLYFS